jgi:hypothetical protein
LIAAVGAAVTVEAGRAAAARSGMVLCAAAVLILASTQVGVVLDPVWTPWIGAVLYLATLASAWATGCGRLKWWVAVVVAASLAAQAHLIFALPVAGLCLVSALLGVAAGRGSGSTGSRRRWIIPGLACAALLWLPTVVAQLADRPGNLTLLWRSSHQSGGGLGLRLALRGLSSATRLIPSWIHRIPAPDTKSSFTAIGSLTLGGSSLWGGSVIIVLVVVGSLATLRSRHGLAVAAWIASTACALTVVGIASVPHSDALEIFYLTVVFVPVGIMAWLVMAGGVLELARWGMSMFRPRAVDDGGLPSSRPRRSRLARVRLASWLLAVVLLAASAIVTVSIGSLERSTEPGGPTAESVTARTAARMVEAKVAGRNPVELDIVGGSSAPSDLVVYWGVAYALFVTGRSVRLDGQLASYVGSLPKPAMGAPTTVTVILDGHNRVIGVRGHQVNPQR